MPTIDELHAQSVSGDLAMLKNAIVKLLRFPQAQAQEPATTTNVGTAQDPIWKVAVQGQGVDPKYQALAEWLRNMADMGETTGEEDFDPDEWMKAQELVYPEAPPGDGDAQ